VRALAGATGTPVGVPGDGRRPHAVEGVPFGSTVLLYTDGLLGDGHRPPDEVLGALAGVLATAGPDPEGVLDAVAAAVVDRDRADDVALLVVTLD
jgi:hypothetical protein